MFDDDKKSCFSRSTGTLDVDRSANRRAVSARHRLTPLAYRYPHQLAKLVNLLVHLSDGYVFWYQGVPHRVLVVGLSKHRPPSSACVSVGETEIYTRESHRLVWGGSTLKHEFCNVFFSPSPPSPPYSIFPLLWEKLHQRTSPATKTNSFFECMYDSRRSTFIGHMVI